MRTRSWMDAFKRVGNGVPSQTAGLDGYSLFPADRLLEGDRRGLHSALFESLSGRNFEFDGVREEVSAEQRSRIVLVGQNPAWSRSLVARLRGQHAPAPESGMHHEGIFVLLDLHDGPAEPLSDLPESHLGVVADDSWTGPLRTEAFSAHDVGVSVTQGDCLLYLWSAGEGWQPEDTSWFARLRMQGKPVIPVALADPDSCVDLDRRRVVAEQLRQMLGVRPVFLADMPLTMPEDVALSPDLQKLLERVVEVCPRLLLPLAQEVAGFRAYAIGRIIRTGALMSALVGAEPVPLLDLPLQVLIQWKVALQIAAVYGRPNLEVPSRELAGTVALNLGFRTIAQQTAKLAPIIGWLLSALCSASCTVVLGKALVRYYEEEPLTWSRFCWRSPLQYVHVPPVLRMRSTPAWRFRRCAGSRNPSQERERVEPEREDHALAA